MFFPVAHNIKASKAGCVPRRTKKAREERAMVFETDNAESRIGRTQETLTTGDGAVSEAYAEMAVQSRQQRTERQAAVAGPTTADWLELTDPFRDIAPRSVPRTDRIQPVPAPPIDLDHDAA